MRHLRVYVPWIEDLCLLGLIFVAVGLQKTSTREQQALIVGLIALLWVKVLAMVVRRSAHDSSPPRRPDSLRPPDSGFGP
jgi:hypothetical protein